MPNYRVEGTSGGSDQHVIEASDMQAAIESYLHYSGIAGLLTEYDEHSDPRGNYRSLFRNSSEGPWSRITISISPPFETCAFEGCDAADDHEEFDKGLCYDHQPEEEEEGEDDDE